MITYLDYNASAPLLKEVKNYIISIIDVHGNPSSIHNSGRKAKLIIELAREEVANLINVNKNDVIFTSGATEANNLALNSFDLIVSSNIEHESILTKENILFIKVDKNGYLDLADLEDKLNKINSSKNVLVSTMLANNETGIIQPIKEIAAITKKFNFCLHTDAVQALGRIKVDMKDLCCDLMTISSHKIGGPKGAGALVINSEKKINSLIKGGSQEKNLRAGTEPLIALAGFGKAARYSNIEAMAKLQSLRDFFEERLIDLNCGIFIIGKNSVRLPNTFMFSLPNIKSENLIMALDLEGFEVSSGSACSSGKVENSKTLMAMGFKENISSSAIRISLGSYNTKLDAIKFAEKVKDINLRYKSLE